MKKLNLFLICLLSGLLSTYAQPQKDLQLAEAVLYGRSSMAPKVWTQLQWIPGKDQSFAYVEYDTAFSPKPAIIFYTAGNNTLQKTAYYLLDSLNPALAAKGLNPLKSIPGITFLTAHEIRFYTNGSFYRFNLNNKQLDELRQPYPGVEYLEWSANGNYLAEVFRDTIQISSTYTSGNNEEHMIINGAEIPMTLGTAVHRNEFGINKGVFFAPDGKGLAYYAMNEQPVTEYPIYTLHQKPAGYRMIRYPMAGAASHIVELRYHRYANGQVNNFAIDVQKKDPEEYLTNIAFNPAGTELYIAHLNRGQNLMELKAYNLADGAYLRTLFTESQEKYVEPLTPMQFLPDGKNFIWLSERDGYNSIYLYDTKGKLKRQLSKNIIVLTVNKISPNGKYIYFTGVKPNSIDKHLYRTAVASGKTEQISKGSGVHNVSINESATLAIDNYTGIDITRIYNLIDLKTKQITPLFIAENPLKNYKIGTVQISTLDQQGTPLFTRLVKPYNFDSTRKYPVVVYVYGGPHAQMITNTWQGGADLWMHYLANQGYLVFTLDNRGSDNRGRDFEQAIFRKLGTPEMEDQLLGVNYLKQLSYVDSTRIGVHGWSYGGFMTTSLMTRNPGIFKVAVAGGPVLDWSLYEIMYTERYMDSPQENPEGYANNALYQYIPNLNGKLLMIHGTDDNVVVWQHSLLYIEECVKKGKQVDYFVYPGHEHNVLGRDRVHLIRKICDYFMDNL